MFHTTMLGRTLSEAKGYQTGKYLYRYPYLTLLQTMKNSTYMLYCYGLFHLDSSKSLWSTNRIGMYLLYSKSRNPLSPYIVHYHNLMIYMLHIRLGIPSRTRIHFTNLCICCPNGPHLCMSLLNIASPLNLIHNQ